MSRLYLMADLPQDTMFYRGIISGIGRYCSEHPELRLRLPNPDWGVIGDNGVIAGSVSIADTHGWTSRFPGPAVNISSRLWPVTVPTVTIDNLAVGRMAADHLVSQGYRAFACHTETRVAFARQRFEGFRSRLMELRRECNLFDTSGRDFTPSASTEVRNATIAWLQKLPKPVGLFCHNDYRASMMIDLCRESGIRVPDQAGVLGMDNDEMLASSGDPPLSSIDPGAQRIGYRAAQLLVGLIRGEVEYREPILLVPAKLVVRGSTQPVFMDDEVLATAVAYIRAHATDPITIDQVLDVAAVSRRSLERRFRERLGRSPGSEIRRVQIEKARYLLADTDQKLSTISKSCGYSNFRNFATAFGRETGMRPSDFRKSQRMQ